MTMRRREFLQTLAVAAGGMMAGGWAAAASKGKKKAGVAGARTVAAPAGSAKPNILVILSDDVGWGDYPCYNPKSKVPAPNIGALAAAGMRFTHAHTPAALCAPTRYSMMTGNYPWRGRSEGGSWNFNCPTHLLPDQQSVAQMLKTAGYRTAMYGKQGFGGYYDTGRPGPERLNNEPLLPERIGLDYSFIIPRGHQAQPLAYFENGKVVGPTNEQGDSVTWDHAKVGGQLLEKAEFFIDDHLSRNKAAGKEAPFFMHFCTNGAHSPYVPAKSIGDVPLEGVTKMDAHTDMVHEVDILVGKLTGMLKARGLLDNTLICFTSDNGGIPLERSYGHDAVGGLRGMKSFIFEGGTRVPFIVRWGDGTPAGSKVPPGTVRDQLVCAHDITATALELAGVAVPKGQCIDAVSLAPVLLGKRDDSLPVRRSLIVQSAPDHDYMHDGGVTRPDSIISKYPKVDPSGEKTPQLMAFALLEGPWKLIFSMQDKPAALYNVDEDVNEQNNLIEKPEHAERIARMSKEFHEIRNSSPHAPQGVRMAAGGKKGKKGQKKAGVKANGQGKKKVKI